LPGCLTAQVIDTLGPGVLSPALQPGKLATVICCRRRHADPALGLSPLRLLIWGLFFLLDPSASKWNLYPRFIQGRREHLCLLTAGLLCGLWWEAWNYPAAAKWVYTLPVLNFARVFEMPS
jgi:hypothetical protein